MGTSSLVAQSKLSSESSQSDGALLLHLIIQRLASSLGKDDLIRIYDFSLNRLSKEIKHDFLMARILEVFFNGFIFVFDLTQEILEQRGVLQMVVGKMLERLEIYQYSYDKKVLNSLSILSSWSFIQILPSFPLLPFIFSILILVLLFSFFPPSASPFLLLYLLSLLWA